MIFTRCETRRLISIRLKRVRKTEGALMRTPEFDIGALFIICFGIINVYYVLFNDYRCIIPRLLSVPISNRWSLSKFQSNPIVGLQL